MKKFLEKTIENNEKQITYYKKIIDKKQTKEDNSSNPAQKFDHSNYLFLYWI